MERPPLILCIAVLVALGPLATGARGRPMASARVPEPAAGSKAVSTTGRPTVLARGISLRAEGLDPKDGPDVDLRIAVEDGEVRFQITTNLAFLDEATDSYREDPSHLAPEEAAGAMEALVDVFRERNVVMIDGAQVLPVPANLARDFEYDQGDPSLVPHFVNYGARAVAKTRLTLRYTCKSAPRRVGITWGVFPPNAVLAVDGEVTPGIEVLCRFAAGGVDRVIKFTQTEPEFIWHREADEGRRRFAEVPPLTAPEDPPFPWLPVGALGASLIGLVVVPRNLRRSLFGPLAVGATAWTALAMTSSGVELPTESEAVQIFVPLHENIYRAFDYTDESDVYDALSQSVDGDLLESLYDDVYRSLVMQEEGGAVSRVAAVRHLETTVGEIGVADTGGPGARAGFQLDALWQVDGAVYHWGHAHTRTNEYRARYWVHGTEAGWRIADSQVLEQRRIDAQPLGDLDMGTPNWGTFSPEDAGTDRPNPTQPEDF